MWTRAELKERAKEVLRNCYWKSFLASILIVIASGGNGSSWRADNSHTPITKEIIYIIIGVLIVFILIRIFLGFMLEVGGRKFFVQAALNDVKLGHIGLAFNKAYYFNVLKSMFLTGLLIILWSLLLIVPGIIKSFAYKFVPYILADNPNIGSKRAIELSNAMTEGHKLDMFVLDLSFLGWILLAMIPFGLGMPFLLPYIDATYAQLYLVLRDNSIKHGFVAAEELNIQLDQDLEASNEDPYRTNF